MTLKDLHILPKFRDGLSYLYVEHCRVEQEGKAIALWDQSGITPVPCASLAVLMLGPGTEISHAAVRALADCGCLAVWCGEEGVRFYASGIGETRNSRNLQRQALLWARRETRMQVVRTMYGMRFKETVPESLSLQQLRGMEGARMREAYQRCSKETGVPWHKRQYDRAHWNASDPINQALSTANSCLYGLCHAAILSLGYCPALGFIHTGRQLSLVFDIADLYKTETTIPVSFEAVKEEVEPLGRGVRLILRDRFRETRLLERITGDLDVLFGSVEMPEEDLELIDADEDMAAPGGLWDGEKELPGGISYGIEDES